MNTKTREQIRARIDMLECLDDMSTAIDEVESVEFDAGDSGTFDLTVDSNGDRKSVTFVNGIPASVLLAGLRAMSRELSELAGAIPATEAA